RTAACCPTSPCRWARWRPCWAFPPWRPGCRPFFTERAPARLHNAQGDNMNPNSDNKRRTLLRAATVGGLGAVLAGAAPPALAKPRVRWRMGMAWTRSAPGYTTPVVALADFLDK